jgi:linoleoyl-CoA desaturase
MLSNWFYGLPLLLLQIMFHFSMFLISVGIAHDGSHSSYSKRPWLNKLTYRVFDLIGINSHMWEYNHNLSHHYVPNIPQYDSAIDSFGLFRFHPRADYHSFHRYQHIYILFIYALSTLFKIFFLDFFSFTRKRIGIVKLDKPKLRDVLYLVFTKAFVIGYTLVVPLMIINRPVYEIISGFIIGNLICGICLGVVFQVTHLSDRTIYVEPNEDGVIDSSFPMHIIQTTSDFATNSSLVTWISGGLNLHVAHHLFPKISQVHLPAITKLLQQTATDLGVPYKQYPTVLSAVVSHLRLLKRLGSKRDAMIAGS